jgi:ADP-ribosylglycohydrolase
MRAKFGQVAKLGQELANMSDGNIYQPSLFPEEEPVPLAALSRQERCRGAVLGAAVGDAMGHPTEFISSFAAIRHRYPPAGVTRFELFWERDGQRFAPYTDDTQMAEIVLRTLLDGHDNLDDCMRRLARDFVEWSHRPQGGHRAPGNASLAGCRALARGATWLEAGGAQAGGCKTAFLTISNASGNGGCADSPCFHAFPVAMMVVLIAGLMVVFESDKRRNYQR